MLFGAPLSHDAILLPGRPQDQTPVHTCVDNGHLRYRGRVDDPSEWLAAAGFSVIPGLLSPEELQGVAKLLASSSDRSIGSRRFIEDSRCAELGRRIGRNPRMLALLPRDAVAVQCTSFIKGPANNWLVSLHQDLSIPVAERVESTECSGWSEKEGELYVRPPAAVLERLLAVRVHLDDCDESNGAIRVVPGSHKYGRLNSANVAGLREAHGEVSVPVARGDAMLMRPLLLHASSKCTGERPRRVLHFVYGPRQLPCGLRWRTAIG